MIRNRSYLAIQRIRRCRHRNWFRWEEEFFKMMRLKRPKKKGHCQKHGKNSAHAAPPAVCNQNARWHDYLKYVLEDMLEHEGEITKEYLKTIVPWSASLPERLKVNTNKK